MFSLTTHILYISYHTIHRHSNLHAVSDLQHLQSSDVVDIFTYIHLYSLTLSHQVDGEKRFER